MTTRTENAEREVKLSAPREFRLPDLHELGLGTVRLPVQALSTSYFDTEDLRLWERRITLRHRVGEDEGNGLWTVKLPGEAAHHEIDRTELSWPGGLGQVPTEAVALLRGIVRRQSLKPVTVLEAMRTRVLLRHHGTPVGEIDDDTVTVASGGRAGRTFRQIEFEFDSGSQGPPPDPTVLEKILTAMRGAGAYVDLEQKFAIALGIHTRRGSVPATKFDRHTTLGTLVQQTLEDEFDRMLDFDVLLRLDPTNPSEHAIHQARVATRRLRSNLKTFGPVLDPVWVRHTRSELKWLGAVFGAVRDIDVLDNRLQAAGSTALEIRGAEELRSKLGTLRREASEALDHALRSDRYLDLLDRLHAGACTPRFHSNPQSDQTNPVAYGPDDLARNVLPQLLGTHWKKLRRRVKKAGRTPSDTQLHRIRIGSKQLRYGAELAEPVLGKAARRTARHAEDIQTILGDHHDSVSAVAWLEQIPVGGTSEASFVAGAKAAEARREQFESRQKWLRAWKALHHGSRTDWLQ